MGTVLAVSAGRPRQLTWLGHPMETAIWKAPVAGPVALGPGGLEGDIQANPEVHGGTHKAVYAYGAGDLAWWSAELGRELAPGTFGENLTIAGLDVSGALVGECWLAGTAELEVSGPRTPCVKLGARMGDPGFPRRFAAAGRPGAYLRVVTPGLIAAGDAVSVSQRPASGLSVAEVSRIYHVERERAGELLGLAALDPVWAAWAARRLRPPAAR